MATFKENLISENAIAEEAKFNEISEKLNDYLTVVVDELVNESEDTLVDTENQAKLTAMIEAFSGFVITTGVDVAVINEAKDNADTGTKYAEQVEANNVLVEKNLELANQNKQFMKMGIINEMKSGLSIVQADKFERLSSLVEFTNDSTYGDRLDTLKESIVGKDEEKEVEKEAVIIAESKSKENSIPSHLI